VKIEPSNESTSSCNSKLPVNAGITQSWKELPTYIAWLTEPLPLVTKLPAAERAFLKSAESATKKSPITLATPATEKVEPNQKASQALRTPEVIPDEAADRELPNNHSIRCRFQYQHIKQRRSMWSTTPQDISWLGISLDRHQRLEEDNTSDKKGLTDEG
jgi:hypothetical protein